MVTVDNSILIYAFRYSLGRKTFAPKEVMDNILENLHKLKEYDIMQIIKEIEQAPSLGMDFDKIEWLKFKRRLEAHILGDDDV